MTSARCLPSLPASRSWSWCVYAMINGELSADVNSLAHSDLEAVSRRLRGALVAFFMRRVGNAAEADDMTQEVFRRLASGNATEVANPDSYVFAIAANLLRDKARRDRVRADYTYEKGFEDYLGIDPLDPLRITIARDQLAQLAGYIAELPEKTRRIFTLYRIENMEKRQIAESFGLSVRMVEIHVQRAMTALYSRMDGET